MELTSLAYFIARFRLELLRSFFFDLPSISFRSVRPPKTAERSPTPPTMAKKGGDHVDLAVKAASPLLPPQPPDPRHNLQMTSLQVVSVVWGRATRSSRWRGPRSSFRVAGEVAATAAAVVCGHLDRCARPCAPHPSTDGTEASRPRTCGGWRPSRGALLANSSRARNDDANRKYGVAPSQSTDLAIDHSRHHRGHAAWSAVAFWSLGGRRGSFSHERTHGFRDVGQARHVSCGSSQQKIVQRTPSSRPATVRARVAFHIAVQIFALDLCFQYSF